jgi:hypothetical protein
MQNFLKKEYYLPRDNINRLLCKLAPETSNNTISHIYSLILSLVFFRGKRKLQEHEIDRERAGALFVWLWDWTRDTRK